MRKNFSLSVGVGLSLRSLPLLVAFALPLALSFSQVSYADDVVTDVVHGVGGAMERVGEKLSDTKFKEDPPSGYNTDIPNADERRAKNSGWVQVLGFPTYEVVREGHSTQVTQVADVIQDPEVKRLIMGGRFSSLQVRELFIRPSEAQRECQSQQANQPPQTFPQPQPPQQPQVQTQIMNPQPPSAPTLPMMCRSIRVPFVASLKHAQSSMAQGTLSVAGVFTISGEPAKLQVQLTGVNDSSAAERFGREHGADIPFSGGENRFQLIDINFANSVLTPIVEKHFAVNPQSLEQLIKMVL